MTSLSSEPDARYFPLFDQRTQFTHAAKKNMKQRELMVHVACYFIQGFCTCARDVQGMDHYALVFTHGQKKDIWHDNVSGNKHKEECPSNHQVCSTNSHRDMVEQHSDQNEKFYWPGEIVPAAQRKSLQELWKSATTPTSIN